MVFVFETDFENLYGKSWTKNGHFGNSSQSVSFACSPNTLPKHSCFRVLNCPIKPPIIMSCYKFNSDKMYYDITDNIAFITSLKTNFYYGINEFETQIFQNLVKGIPTEKFFTKLKKLGIEENNFSFFVKDLVENEILVDSVESDKEIKIEKITDDLNFELNKYNNLYKTLKLYKIHNNKTVEDFYLENSINNGNNINTLSVQKDFEAILTKEQKAELIKIEAEREAVFKERASKRAERSKSSK